MALILRLRRHAPRATPMHGRHPAGGHRHRCGSRQGRGAAPTDWSTDRRDGVPRLLLAGGPGSRRPRRDSPSTANFSINAVRRMEIARRMRVSARTAADRLRVFAGQAAPMSCHSPQRRPAPLNGQARPRRLIDARLHGADRASICWSALALPLDAMVPKSFSDLRLRPRCLSSCRSTSGVRLGAGRDRPAPSMPRSAQEAGGHSLSVTARRRACGGPTLFPDFSFRSADQVPHPHRRGDRCGVPVRLRPHHRQRLASSSLQQRLPPRQSAPGRISSALANYTALFLDPGAVPVRSRTRSSSPSSPPSSPCRSPSASPMR